MSIGSIIQELAEELNSPLGISFSFEYSFGAALGPGFEVSLGFYYDEAGVRYDFFSFAGSFEVGLPPPWPSASIEGELVLGTQEINDFRGPSLELEGTFLLGAGLSFSLEGLVPVGLKLIGGSDVAASLELQYTFFADQWGFVDAILSPYIDAVHDHLGTSPYAEWQLRGSLGEDVGSYEDWAPPGAPPAPVGAPTGPNFDFLPPFDNAPVSYAGSDQNNLMFAFAPGHVDGRGGDDTILAFNIKEGADGQTLEQERQELTIDAGSGNDWVYSRGATEIFLGDGDDVLIHAGRGSVITTGPGEDTVLFSPGTLVTDADGYDRVGFGLGLLVPELAISIGESESPYAYALGGLIKVGFNHAGEMVVGDIHSDDNDPSDFMYFSHGNSNPMAAPEDLTAGIRVGHIEIHAYWLQDLPEGISSKSNADVWAFMHLARKEMFDGVRVGNVDPLVLDLDGDGLELSAYGAGPLFDMDGDLFAEPTGWVRGDDGFLALDANENGTIDDVSELFGHAGMSGFAELALLDSNTDGVINASDAAFADLRVWRDIDGDGVTDAGELLTLAEAGVASISLASTPDGSGNALNTVARTGTFTRTDATTGTVGDVEFQIDNFNTVFLGDTSVDPTIAATMPNLKGHGTLADLHVALTLEGPGGPLAAAINANLPNLNVIDLAGLRAAAMPILAAWTAAPPAVAGPPANPNVPILVRDAESCRTHPRGCILTRRANVSRRSRRVQDFRVALAA